VEKLPNGGSPTEILIVAENFPAPPLRHAKHHRDDQAVRLAPDLQLIGSLTMSDRQHSTSSAAIAAGKRRFGHAIHTAW
jgi:hypothetical protein